MTVENVRRLEKAIWAFGIDSLTPEELVAWLEWQALSDAISASLRRQAPQVRQHLQDLQSAPLSAWQRRRADEMPLRDAAQFARRIKFAAMSQTGTVQPPRTARTRCSHGRTASHRRSSIARDDGDSDPGDAAAGLTPVIQKIIGRNLRNAPTIDAGFDGIDAELVREGREYRWTRRREAGEL